MATESTENCEEMNENSLDETNIIVEEGNEKCLGRAGVSSNTYQFQQFLIRDLCTVFTQAHAKVGQYCSIQKPRWVVISYSNEQDICLNITHDPSNFLRAINGFNPELIVEKANMLTLLSHDQLCTDVDSSIIEMPRNSELQTYRSHTAAVTFQKLYKKYSPVRSMYFEQSSDKVWALAVVVGPLLDMNEIEKVETSLQVVVDNAYQKAKAYNKITQMPEFVGMNHPMKKKYLQETSSSQRCSSSRTRPSRSINASSGKRGRGRKAINPDSVKSHSIQNSSPLEDTDCIFKETLRITLRSVESVLMQIDVTPFLFPLIPCELMTVLQNGLTTANSKRWQDCVY